MKCNKYLNGWKHREIYKKLKNMIQENQLFKKICIITKNRIRKILQ